MCADLFIYAYSLVDAAQTLCPVQEETIVEMKYLVIRGEKALGRHGATSFRYTFSLNLPPVTNTLLRFIEK